MPTAPPAVAPPAILKSQCRLMPTAPPLFQCTTQDSPQPSRQRQRCARTSSSPVDITQIFRTAEESFWHYETCTAHPYPSHIIASDFLPSPHPTHHNVHDFHLPSIRTTCDSSLRHDARAWKTHPAPFCPLPPILLSNVIPFHLIPGASVGRPLPPPPPPAAHSNNIS